MGALPILGAGGLLAFDSAALFGSYKMGHSAGERPSTDAPFWSQIAIFGGMVPAAAVGALTGAVLSGALRPQSAALFGAMTIGGAVLGAASLVGSYALGYSNGNTSFESGAGSGTHVMPTLPIRN